MSDLRACVVCGEPIESKRGEPCALCGDWFHHSFSKAPGVRICGVFSDAIPGLIS